MTTDAFERSLGLFNRRKPFRSFLIEFASGDRVEVRHPEAVVPAGNLYVLRAPDREQRLFEAARVIQLIDPAPPK